MTRIVDVRLVLDRDDVVRVSVDGRPLMRAESVAAALRFAAEHLERVEPREQLARLATAIVAPTTSKAPVAPTTGAPSDPTPTRSLIDDHCST